MKKEIQKDIKSIPNNLSFEAMTKEMDEIKKEFDPQGYHDFLICAVGDDEFNADISIFATRMETDEEYERRINMPKNRYTSLVKIKYTSRGL